MKRIQKCELCCPFCDSKMSSRRPHSVGHASIHLSATTASTNGHFGPPHGHPSHQQHQQHHSTVIALSGNISLTAKMGGSISATSSSPTSATFTAAPPGSTPVPPNLPTTFAPSSLPGATAPGTPSGGGGGAPTGTHVHSSHQAAAAAAAAAAASMNNAAAASAAMAAAAAAAASGQSPFCPGADKTIDLNQLTPDQRQKLETFLKMSGFGPLKKTGKLDAGMMRKLAQHVKTAGGIPSPRTSTKDGQVRKAVLDRKKDELLQLLSSGANADDPEPKNHTTSLMLAAREGLRDYVEILLDRGANVEAKSHSGATALMEACQRGHLEIVQLLVERGAEVDEVDNKNWSPITYCASIGNVKIAKYLLEHGGFLCNDPTDKADGLLDTPLSVACARSKIDFVKWLTSFGLRETYQPLEIQIALHRAVQAGKKNLVKHMIDNGARPVPVYTEDDMRIADPTKHEQPLCIASACGHLEIADYLLKLHVPVHVTDGVGMSPLMHASKEGKLNMVKWLVEKNADVNALSTQDQLTPLCYAAAAGHFDIVRELISHHADVHAGADKPFLLAILNNRTNLVEYFIEQVGVDPVLANNRGDNALAYACETGTVNLVQTFLALHCEPDVVGSSGMTPLMRACKHSHRAIVELLLKFPIQVNRLSADNEHTALSLACGGGCEDIVRLLMSHGADPRVKLKDNNSCLIQASKAGNAKIVRMLLAYQKDQENANGGGANGGAGSATTEALKKKRQQKRSMAGVSKHHRQQGANKRRHSKQQTNIDAANMPAFAANLSEGEGMLNVADGMRAGGNAYDSISNASSGTQRIMYQNHAQQQQELALLAEQEQLAASSMASAEGVGFQQYNVDDEDVDDEDGTSLDASEDLSDASQNMPELEDGDVVQHHHHYGPDVTDVVSSTTGNHHASRTQRGAVLQQRKRAPTDETFDDDEDEDDDDDDDEDDEDEPDDDEEVDDEDDDDEYGGSLDSDIDEEDSGPCGCSDCQANAGATAAGEPYQSFDTAAHNASLNEFEGMQFKELGDFVRFCFSESQRDEFLPVLRHEIEKHTAMLHQLGTSPEDIKLWMLEQMRKQAASDTSDAALHQMMQTMFTDYLTTAERGMQTLQAEASNTRAAIEGQQQAAAGRVLANGTDEHSVLAGEMHPSQLLQQRTMTATTTTTRQRMPAGQPILPRGVQNAGQQTTTTSRTHISSLNSNELDRALKSTTTTMTTTVAANISPTKGGCTGVAGTGAHQCAIHSHNNIQQQQQQQQAYAPYSTDISAADVMQQLTAGNPAAAALAAAAFSGGNTVKSVLPRGNGTTTTTTMTTKIQHHPASSKMTKANMRNMAAASAGMDANSNIAAYHQHHHCKEVGGICTGHTTTTITGGQVVEGMNSHDVNTSMQAVAAAAAAVRAGQQLNGGIPLPVGTPGGSIQQQRLDIQAQQAQLQLQLQQQQAQQQQLLQQQAQLQQQQAQHVDVNGQTDGDQTTALICAAKSGNDELVSLLLESGANIELKDKRGWTALGYAAEKGHAQVVEKLCEKGADLEILMDTSQAKRDTALTIGCYAGRVEVVRVLLHYGANKEHRNSNDYTPLSVAALNGHVEVVDQLLKSGAEINARTGSKLGISPLMLASMNGHTKVVRLLLDHGSDINAHIETNRNSALTLAAFQGRHEVVLLLCEKGANLEWRSKNGLTPLMEAATGGYVDVGRVLLQHGADINAPPINTTKDTALTIAADKGRREFVELLIKTGAQVEAKNKKGCSALWLACNQGHEGVVRTLVDAGANVDSEDNRHVTCIMAAFRKGHDHIVKLLVDRISHYPSELDLDKVIRDINLRPEDCDVLQACLECKHLILEAKKRKQLKADREADKFLEELEREEREQEEKRAKKREKRQRKKNVPAGKDGEMENDSVADGDDLAERIGVTTSSMPSLTQTAAAAAERADAKRNEERNAAAALASQKAAVAAATAEYVTTLPASTTNNVTKSRGADAAGKQAGSVAATKAGLTMKETETTVSTNAGTKASKVAPAPAAAYAAETVESKSNKASSASAARASAVATNVKVANKTGSGKDTVDSPEQRKQPAASISATNLTTAGKSAAVKTNVPKSSIPAAPEQNEPANAKKKTSASAANTVVIKTNVVDSKPSAAAQQTAASVKTGKSTTLEAIPSAAERKQQRKTDTATAADAGENALSGDVNALTSQNQKRADAQQQQIDKSKRPKKKSANAARQPVGGDDEELGGGVENVPAVTTTTTKSAAPRNTSSAAHHDDDYGFKTVGSRKRSVDKLVSQVSAPVAEPAAMSTRNSAAAGRSTTTNNAKSTTSSSTATTTTTTTTSTSSSSRGDSGSPLHHWSAAPTTATDTDWGKHEISTSATTTNQRGRTNNKQQQQQAGTHSPTRAVPSAATAARSSRGQTNAKQQNSASQKTRSHSSHGADGAGGHGGGGSNKYDSGWKEVISSSSRQRRIKLTSSAVSRIIGRSGVNITAIRQYTNAHIEIEKNKSAVAAAGSNAAAVAAASNERTVTIRGSAESVNDAYRLIQALVERSDADVEHLIATLQAEKDSKKENIAPTSTSTSSSGNTGNAASSTPVKKIQASSPFGSDGASPAVSFAAVAAGNTNSTLFSAVLASGVAEKTAVPATSAAAATNTSATSSALHANDFGQFDASSMMPPPSSTTTNGGSKRNSVAASSGATTHNTQVFVNSKMGGASTGGNKSRGGTAGNTSGTSSSSSKQQQHRGSDSYGHHHTSSTGAQQIGGGKDQQHQRESNYYHSGSTASSGGASGRHARPLSASNPSHSSSANTTNTFEFDMPGASGDGTDIWRTNLAKSQQQQHNFTSSFGSGSHNTGSAATGGPVVMPTESMFAAGDASSSSVSVGGPASAGLDAVVGGGGAGVDMPMPSFGTSIMSAMYGSVSNAGAFGDMSVMPQHGQSLWGHAGIDVLQDPTAFSRSELEDAGLCVRPNSTGNNMMNRQQQPNAVGGSAGKVMSGTNLNAYAGNNFRSMTPPGLRGGGNNGGARRSGSPTNEELQRAPSVPSPNTLQTLQHMRQQHQQVPNIDVMQQQHAAGAGGYVRNTASAHLPSAPNSSTGQYVPVSAGAMYQQQFSQQFNQQRQQFGSYGGGSGFAGGVASGGRVNSAGGGTQSVLGQMFGSAGMTNGNNSGAPFAAGGNESWSGVNEPDLMLLANKLMNINGGDAGSGGGGWPGASVQQQQSVNSPSSFAGSTFFPPYMGQQQQQQTGSDNSAVKSPQSNNNISPMGNGWGS